MSVILPTIDPEFKSFIPSLLEDEYAQLEQNIVSCGACRDAIILWEGIILDGHNRFEICVRHGIEFKVTEISLASRDEAKLWILENQLGRRNLNDAMRIEIVLLKEELLRERAKKNLSLAGGDRKSPLSKKTTVDESIHVQKAMARQADVSEGTFYSYTQVRENGSPELLEQVKSGKLKIGTAHRLLSKQITKQLGIADKMYKFIAQHMPPKDDEPANIHIHDRLAQLPLLLQELISRLEEQKTRCNVNKDVQSHDNHSNEKQCSIITNKEDNHHANTSEERKTPCIL